MMMKRWLRQVYGLAAKEWRTVKARWFLDVARALGAMAFIAMGALIVAMLDTIQGPRVKIWSGSRPYIGIVEGVEYEKELEVFLGSRGCQLLVRGREEYLRDKHPGVLSVAFPDPRDSLVIDNHPKCSGAYYYTPEKVWTGPCALHPSGSQWVLDDELASKPAPTYMYTGIFPWEVTWPRNITVTPLFDYEVLSAEISTMQLAYGLSALNDFVQIRTQHEAPPPVSVAYYFPGKEQSGWVKAFVGFTVFFGLWSLSITPAQRIYEERITGTRELLRWSGASETAYAASHVLFSAATSIPFILPPALILGWGYLYSAITCMLCITIIATTLPAVVYEWRWVNNIFSVASFACVGSAHLLGPTQFAPFACVNPAVAFMYSWPDDDVDCFSWKLSSSFAKAALAADVVLYTIIAWYLVQVRPAEQGGRPWAFPFMFQTHHLSSLRIIRDSHKTPSSPIDDLNPAANLASSISSMQPDPPGAPAIECDHLTKRYPSGAADVLKDFCFTVKEGEIYALLGRNGAGKSTVIKMLTGCISPGTYKSAHIRGHDIATEMEAIKSQLGLCLQTDVVWEGLTAVQHMHVIASLRGASDQLDLLEALGVPSHVLAGKMSGGLKRRLCIAMALIGKPSVIILDEPCASLDPIGRMKTWNLLGKYRDAGCTVLVTTQHVDEAAQLGDRIGIMENGTIKCSGDVDFLDSVFWKSHTITATLSAECDKNAERFNPEKLGIAYEQRGRDLFMKLDTEQQVVDTLQKLEGEQGVENIALGTTGLEDAFMSVGGGHKAEASGLDFDQLPKEGHCDWLVQLSVMVGVRLKTFLRSRSQVVQRFFIVFTISIISLITHKMDCTSHVSSDNSFFVIDNAGVGDAMSQAVRHGSKLVMDIYTSEAAFADQAVCSLSTPVGVHINSVSPRNATVLLVPTASKAVTSYVMDLMYSYMNDITVRGVPVEALPKGDAACTSDLESLTVMFGASLVTAVALQQSYGVTESARDFTRGTIHALQVIGLKPVVYWAGAVYTDVLLILPLAVFAFVSPSLFEISALQEPLIGVWVLLLGVCVSLVSQVIVVLLGGMATVQVLVVILMFITVSSCYLSIFMSRVYTSMELGADGTVGLLLRNITPASTFVFAMLDRNVGATVFAFFVHIVMMCLMLWWALTRLRPRQPHPPHDIPNTDIDVATEEARCAKSDDPISVRGLYKLYPGSGLNALQGVTLGLEPGECLGVLGPNGAGKSTLINIISGLEQASAGEVLLKKPISVCPQQDVLWDKLTVVEHVRCYLRVRYGEVDEEVVEKWAAMGCREVGLGGCRGMAEGLSGGTRRKLQVMLSLFSGAEVVLLDEPSSGMDPASRISLWNAIRKTLSFGKSVILTTHSMKEAESACSRIGIFVSSRLRCIGSPLHLKHRFGNGFTISFTPTFANRQEDDAKLCQIGCSVRELSTAFNGIVVGVDEAGVTVRSQSGEERYLILSSVDHVAHVGTAIGNLKMAFEKTFPEAVKVDRRNRNTPIKYCLPATMQLSHCYSEIAGNKQKWGCASFTISQAIGLEQIFVKLANKYTTSN